MQIRSVNEFESFRHLEPSMRMASVYRWSNPQRHGQVAAGNFGVAPDNLKNNFAVTRESELEKFYPIGCGPPRSINQADIRRLDGA